MLVHWECYVGDLNEGGLSRQNPLNLFKKTGEDA